MAVCGESLATSYRFLLLRAAIIDASLCVSWRLYDALAVVGFEPLLRREDASEACTVSL